MKRLKEIEAKVEEATTTLEQVLESQLEELSDTARKLVPTDLPVAKQLAWIASNRAILAKPTAFDIGSGKRGAGKGEPKVKATPEQIAVARSYGLSIDEYMKFAAGNSGFADADQDTDINKE